MKEVRKLRLLREFSLDDVYIFTRIPPSRLSRLERGIVRAKPREKELIAKALGQPVEIVFPPDEA